MNIICKKCGSIDDYRTEMKSNNLVAYCNGCDNYIKNIPYAEPMLYVGKYKGVAIANIEDVGYLEWARAKMTLTQVQKDALTKQIRSLNLTHV